MFSYVDLVRVEIALEVEERFGVTISDEETDGWRTLEDVARSVVGRARVPVQEAEAVGWIRALIVEGYGVPETTLTPEAEVFGDYDRMTAWFFAAPYPHGLGGRCFAANRGIAASGQTESGAAPDRREE